MRARKLTEAQAEILEILRGSTAGLSTTTVARESGYNHRLALRSLQRLRALGLADRSVRTPKIRSQEHGGALRAPKVMIWSALPPELILEAAEAEKARQLKGRIRDLERLQREAERELSGLLNSVNP